MECEETNKSFGRNPLTSYPFDSVQCTVHVPTVVVCEGKNLLFRSPCIEWFLYTDRTWGVDWWIVYVRYWTIPVVSVLTCILQCTVLSCFKLRRLVENKVFYPQGGCGGRKNFSFRHLRHLGDSPLSPPGGGRENLRNFWILAVGFCRLLFFLAPEEQVSKQLKRVSIVGIWRKHFNYSTLGPKIIWICATKTEPCDGGRRRNFIHTHLFSPFKPDIYSYHGICYCIHTCDGLGFKAENQIIFGTVYWYLNKSTYRMRYRCVEGNVVFYPVVDPLREKYKINILISTVYETIYKSW